MKSIGQMATELLKVAGLQGIGRMVKALSSKAAAGTLGAAGASRLAGKSAQLAHRTGTRSGVSSLLGAGALRGTKAGGIGASSQIKGYLRSVYGGPRPLPNREFSRRVSPNIARDAGTGFRNIQEQSSAAQRALRERLSHRKMVESLRTQPGAVGQPPNYGTSAPTPARWKTPLA